MKEIIIFAAVMLLTLPLMLCIFWWLYTDKEQDEIDNEILNSFIDECFKNK